MRDDKESNGKESVVQSHPEPFITADDLVAASSGLAAGTLTGAFIGAALSGPALLPVGLGITGMIAGAAYHRLGHPAERDDEI